MNHSILPILFLSIILVFSSCFRDVVRDIGIDNKPFNNFDDKGNTQLTAGSEIIILIPDIQNYIYYKRYNKILESIIDRIIEINKIGYKVKAVVQVGDITETNSPDEWKIAKTIFSKLDSVKINYILTTGNHDYSNSEIPHLRQTFFNDYFDFSGQPSFKKCFIDTYYENSLFEINIHGKPFQIIALEFGPREVVLEWANKVMDKNKKGLLVTHAYLFKHNERYNWINLKNSQSISPYNYSQNNKSFEGDVNDGEDIWQKLIYTHGNINFVACGHKTKPDYIGNLISKNIQDKNVLQMLFNTQDLPNGGDGWIQILEFKNDRKLVGIKTYSCVYNKWNNDSICQYNFIYE
ncbi:MAG: metallophosphoesterase [Bacteroidaceae bacterium]|nr:metallophosphoesterase [Bacteroidaceae bacterium]